MYDYLTNWMLCTIVEWGFGLCVVCACTAWFESQRFEFYKGRELSGVVTGLAC